MPIVTCPRCRKSLEVQPASIGFFVTCCFCGETFGAESDDPNDRPPIGYSDRPVYEPPQPPTLWQRSPFGIAFGGTLGYGAAIAVMWLIVLAIPLLVCGACCFIAAVEHAGPASQVTTR